jgi:hypothetical protein
MEEEYIAITSHFAHAAVIRLWAMPRIQRAFCRCSYDVTLTYKVIT